MKLHALLLTATLAVVALAGCSDPPAEEAGDVIPEELRERDIQELEELAAGVPKRFAFPGQEPLETITCIFEDVVDPGTGFLSPELPNDEGPIDAGGAYILMPVDGCTDAETGETVELPDGQPVELRLKLKWWGDPGSAADLDIFVNVPGARDAHTPDRFDESFNWNIVTKFRVVNTVIKDAEPFEFGIQVSNGKNIHPDGIRYAYTAEFVYAHRVLAPGIPYAITVPEGASGLIFESEPLVGDEHVTSELVIVDPDDQLVRHIRHNDIATETILVPIQKAGEYVIYSHAQHGGFLRVETDIPNPDFEARILERTETRTPVWTAPAPPVPGTYSEQCFGGQICPGGANSFGDIQNFEPDVPFPLDVQAYVFTGGGPSVDAAINISSERGWVSTAAANGNFDDGENRVGPHHLERHKRSNIVPGAYQYGLVVNGGAAEVGYVVVGYVR